MIKNILKKNLNFLFLPSSKFSKIFDYNFKCGQKGKIDIEFNKNQYNISVSNLKDVLNTDDAFLKLMTASTGATSDIPFEVKSKETD